MTPEAELTRTHELPPRLTGSSALAVEVAAWRDHAQNWEAVARNLAQVLTNTAAWVETVQQGGNLGVLSPDELREAFRKQCEAHGVTP